MKFPFLASFILLIVFLNLRMRRVSRKEEEKEASFWERELQSNNVRKKSLENLDYIHIPYDLLPFGSAGDNNILQKSEETLTSLKDEKIVNLTGISNTDLKLTYGAPNLPILSEYDQNFTTLCKAILDLGIEYKNAGYTDEAVATLNVGIRVGTDLSLNYTTLAEIYAERGLYVEIQRLINCAGNIRSLTRNSTISKLQNILDEHTSSVIKLSDDDPSDRQESSSQSSSSGDPGSILPADILDILENVPDTESSQK